jgi:HEAT repeat protein
MMQPKRLASHNKSIARFCNSQFSQLGLDTQAELSGLCLDESDSNDRRGRACYVLGFLNPPGALETLINLAKGSNMYVAICAINSLSVIKSHKATGPLIKLAKESTNEEVKNAAIMCLGHLGDKKAEAVVRSLLITSKSEYTRSAAAQALSTLAHQEQSFEALISALHDESAAVRWTAAVTLGNVGNENSVGPLKSRIADKESVPGLPPEETVGRATERALQQIAAKAARRRTHS